MMWIELVVIACVVVTLLSTLVCIYCLIWLLLRDASGTKRGEWCASVTIDGREYLLGRDGERIVNTTEKVIPAGTAIYWTKPPIVPHP